METSVSKSIPTVSLSLHDIVQSPRLEKRDDPSEFLNEDPITIIHRKNAVLEELIRRHEDQLFIRTVNQDCLDNYISFEEHEHKIQELRLQIEKLEKQIEQLKDQNSKLEEQNQIIKQDVEIFRKTMMEAQSDLRMKNQKIQELLKEKASSAFKVFIDAFTQTPKREPNLTTSKTFLFQINPVAPTTTTTDKEFIQLREQMKILIKEKQTFLSKITNLEMHKKSIEKEYERQKERIHELESYAKELCNFLQQNELQKMQEALEAAVIHTSKVMDRAEAVEKENEELTRTVDRLKKSNEKYLSLLHSLHQSQQKLLEKDNELRSINEKYEKALQMLKKFQNGS